MKQIALLSLLFIILFTSCRYIGRDSIKGNGHVTVETRSVSGFAGIEVSSAIQLYIKQDSVFSVKVEIDSNLQKYIIIEKDGNDVLHIRQQNNSSLDATGKIKVYVAAPVIDKLKASGACDIIGQNKLSSVNDFEISMSGACSTELNVKAPKVIVGLSGACSVTLSGETKDFIVDGSGSTNIKCFGLMTENTDVKLSGAGNAEVFASVKLDVDVSGAADVRYKGNPVVNQKVSGAGSVKKVETPNH